jgi:ATP-dependent Clp protease ATP-binding subunit ClpA
MGKTETAKVLAQLLKRHLIKLDMSEYSDITSVNKIIGSSPGYIGYDDRLSLFHELVLYPHSILLLDEIEKAHPQVSHLFLQVFDEGVLKDNHSHLINFKDTIVIMTSNASYQNKSSVGFKKQNCSLDELRDVFSEEFLNRIDEIITYKTLDLKAYQDILLKNAPIALNQETLQDILKDYNVSLGARPLLSKMKKYLTQKTS